MFDSMNIRKSPYVQLPNEMLLFQFGKTNWELDVTKSIAPQKRTFLDRLIGFDPNAPIKRTSFFDIVEEDEHYYHCVIGFKDQKSGQFTYTLLRKETDKTVEMTTFINDYLVLVTKNAFLEGNRTNPEESFIMDVIEESAIYSGSKIIAEEPVDKGQLKQKYKISLARNRQLVVNGYHYAFIVASYALLHHFDGHQDFLFGGDVLDLDSGGGLL